MTKSLGSFFREDLVCLSELALIDARVSNNIWNVVVWRAVQDPIEQQLEPVEDSLWLESMS